MTKFKLMRKTLDIHENEHGMSDVAIANLPWNNGELDGAMSVIISDKRYDALKKVGIKLSELLNSSHTASEELSASSEEMAATARSRESSTSVAKTGLAKIEYQKVLVGYLHKPVF